MPDSGAHVDTTTSPNPLILGSRVQGTAVYSADGDKIGHVEDVAIGKQTGHVEDVAIGKQTGHVAYAILSFGGFLGMGEKYHPIPWSVLTYEPSKGGYVTNLGKAELTAAPVYSKSDLAGLGDDEERLRRDVYPYYVPYGATPYWP